MSAIRVIRPGAPDLVFEGELLATAGSKEYEAQRRWQEASVWRTDTGRYVTQLVGRSIVPGEKDRQNTAHFDDAAEVWKGLVRRTANPYLTDLAKQVLANAARKDPALRAATEQHLT